MTRPARRPARRPTRRLGCVVGLTLAVIAAVLGLAAGPAAANAQRAVYGPNASVVRATIYSTGVSPPRGRASMCVEANAGGNTVRQITAQVYWTDHGYTSASPNIVSNLPPTGRCVIADDFEWYYTSRYLSGALLTVTWSNGTRNTVYCTLTVCNKTT